MAPRIELIHKEKALGIITERWPLGCFLLADAGMWVGIDNRSGDAWTEQFGSFGRCVLWLRGEEKKNGYDEESSFL